MSNTNIFPKTNCTKRTNAEFRERTYGAHHKIDSPILELDIDMVEQFPVADSLHLLHLGLMKRLLLGWRDGTFRKSDTKWRSSTTNEVSSYLLGLRMPREFRRAVRGLDCLKHWKGTEYRTFLHYAGIVILKEHLPAEAYTHFLLLFCAVTICSSKKYFHLLSVTHSMLLQFIEIFGETYGEHHINSNVHNLSHMVDDVRRFGELDTFSAYTFESALGGIKRLIKTGSRPLPQIARRLTEEYSCKLDHDEAAKNASKLEAIPSKKRNYSENVAGGEGRRTSYSKLKLKEFCLATDPSNCWFFTKGNKVVRLLEVIQHNDSGNFDLVCVEIEEKDNFFTIPFESRHLDIYCAPKRIESKENKETITLGLSDVNFKMVRMPAGRNNVFIPLLHTKQ